MTSEIEVRREAITTAFEPQTLGELMRFADWMSDCNLLPDHLRGRPKDFVLIAIKGREMGMTLMQSISCINVIKGRTVISAEGIVAKTLQHRDCVYFIPVESTEKVATYRTLRRGAPQPVELSWTIEMAKRAGLVQSNQAYGRHTEAMLRARCAMALARAVFPDAVLGMNEPGEGAEIAGRPVPVEPAPPVLAPVEQLRPRTPVATLVDETAAAIPTEAIETCGSASRADERLYEPASAARAEEEPDEESPAAGADSMLQPMWDAIESLRELGWRDDGKSVPVSLDQAAAVWLEVKPRLTAETAGSVWKLLLLASNAPSTRQLKLAVARAENGPPKPPRGGGEPAPANDPPAADPEREAIQAADAAGAQASTPRPTPTELQRLAVAREALKLCNGHIHVARHYAAHVDELPASVRGIYRDFAVVYLTGRYPRAVGTRDKAEALLDGACANRTVAA